MKKKRPHFNKSIYDLENIWSTSKIDSVRNELLYELSFRKTPNALKLKESIERFEIDNFSTQTDKNNENVAAASTTIPKETSSSNEVNLESLTENNLEVSWDSSQKLVIDLTEDEMSFVQAGPGAGKTAVACKRIANLVEEYGLDAPKILLVSFTRAAVKELQNRILSYAKEPLVLAGLKILTLDSLTWQVVRGIGGDSKEDLLKGYESNIQRLIEMIRSEDEDIIEYLEELQHVVIDEGQDLVGPRAQLVVSIIGKLPSDCGITIFADRAQAIYGWTNEEHLQANKANRTLVERILVHKELKGFKTMELNGVHRTTDTKLLNLYKLGRKRLVDRNASSAADWREMKNLVSEHAHNKVHAINKHKFDNCNDVLILYRTRSEALLRSSFMWSEGIVHKLRMSGIPMRISPWIGRLFSNYTDDFLTHDKFIDLWKSNIDYNSMSFLPSAKVAWQLLQEHAGDRDGKIVMRRLRSILSRERPPVEFLLDESAIPGPVIGTIHGSKGREAGEVFLMMPSDDYIRDDLPAHAIAEEERVLYVGATRARKNLNVGNSPRNYASSLENSGRSYRRTRKKSNGLQVEIGRRGDVDPTSVADSNIKLHDVEALQDWLWSNAVAHVELCADYSKKNERYEIFTASPHEKKRFICAFSKLLRSDLWNIGKTKGKNYKPDEKIRHLHMIGSATAVVDEINKDKLVSPYRESRFLIVPIVTGYSMIYFNRY